MKPKVRGSNPLGDIRKVTYEKETEEERKKADEGTSHNNETPDEARRP